MKADSDQNVPESKMLAPLVEEVDQRLKESKITIMSPKQEEKRNERLATRRRFFCGELSLSSNGASQPHLCRTAITYKQWQGHHPLIISLLLSLPKDAPTWHNLRSAPFSPPHIIIRRRLSSSKRRRFLAFSNQQVLDLRPRPRLPRLPPPPHNRGPEPGPPQQGLRGGRVPEAGPGEDPDRAGAHGLPALDGVRQDEAAGGVRQSHRRRRVQRDHMGRGGGPLVSGDRVGEGRDGEGSGGARGQGHWEYRFVFGAPGSRVLQALGLCGRPGWDPRNGVFQKAQEAEMMPNPLCCFLMD